MQREVRKRVEASPKAAAAVRHLQRAGIPEDHLWLILSGALHVNQASSDAHMLSDGDETDDLRRQHEQVRKASNALAVLAECTDEALSDWPSLFCREASEFSVQRIIAAFGEISQMVEMLALLAKRRAATLNAVRYAEDGDDQATRQAAARRFAIGEIAYWIEELDPKHKSRAGQVASIAKALFGGKLMIKQVLDYRDERSELERVWETTRFDGIAPKAKSKSLGGFRIDRDGRLSAAS